MATVDTITDRLLNSSKCKPQAKPFEYTEKKTGFGIRILPGGSKSFILQKRIPGRVSSKTGKPYPARLTLGHSPMMTLAQAREKAKEWSTMIDRGKDPTIEEKRAHEAAVRTERDKQRKTVLAAINDYSKRKLTKLRSARYIETELRKLPWLDRPIADITPRDARDLIEGIVDEGHETHAHLVFSLARAFFNWCIDREDYGIETSPFDRLKPDQLIGPRKIGKRDLDDGEIRSYWKAASSLPYPTGPFFQILLLTACRRDEVREMKWSEIDLKAGLWTIPGARMKGKGEGRTFVVPLTPMLIELLESLPRGRFGDYVLSNDGGRTALSGMARIKARLDTLMKSDLGTDLKPFQNRDVRRTCRTQFSKLRLADDVKEALLAHAKTGLRQVYDRYDLLDEKKDGLIKWHARLKLLAEPPTGNIVQLRA